MKMPPWAEIKGDFVIHNILSNRTYCQHISQVPSCKDHLSANRNTYVKQNQRLIWYIIKQDFTCIAKELAP